MYHEFVDDRIGRVKDSSAFLRERRPLRGDWLQAKNATAKTREGRMQSGEAVQVVHLFLPELDKAA